MAVCDTPAGRFQFYGYVKYEDGTYLGNKEGDEPQFDPGVLREGNRTYLYTGFCARGDRSRSGAMALKGLSSLKHRLLESMEIRIILCILPFPCMNYVMRQANIQLRILNMVNGPLQGYGEYSTYIACNLFCDEESVYTDFTSSWMNNQFPKITQDGKDGDEETGFIANMKNSATV